MGGHQDCQQGPPSSSAVMCVAQVWIIISSSFRHGMCPLDLDHARRVYASAAVSALLTAASLLGLACTIHRCAAQAT